VTVEPKTHYPLLSSFTHCQLVCWLQVFNLQEVIGLSCVSCRLGAHPPLPYIYAQHWLLRTWQWRDDKTVDKWQRNRLSHLRRGHFGGKRCLLPWDNSTLFGPQPQYNKWKQSTLKTTRQQQVWYLYKQKEQACYQMSSSMLTVSVLSALAHT